MARSAQQRRARALQAQTRQARPKKTRPQRPAYEQEMFFPKLRRQAKWMFVFLALTFGVGFVVFGVGSGQGTGLGDILQGNFGGSGGPSIGSARKQIAKDPRNAAPYKELATALTNDGREDEAITALDTYVRLKPKDYDAMQQLAGLYLGRAGRLRDESEIARAQAAEATGGGIFGPSQSTKLGQAVQGRIDQERATLANSKLSEAYTGMENAYTQAARLYQRIVAVRPDDALLRLQLADAAYAARMVPLAVRSYKAFVKLAPDDSSAPYARQQIAQLQSGAANIPSR